MGEGVLVFAAGAATALATGVGAIPVFALGQRAAELRPLLLGIAIGLMGIASIVGLLLPALDDGSTVTVAAGLACGFGFLALTRIWLGSVDDVHVGALRGAGVRTSVLVFVVLFVHSLPEGLALGTAWGSSREGLGLFVFLAIALQNIPEGTSVAIPMATAGFSRSQQFWGAVLTSVPQPFGALVAWLLVTEISALLAFSFAFAAGAMLTLVAWELVPSAFSVRTWRPALAGAVAGGLVMLALSAILGV